MQIINLFPTLDGTISQEDLNEWRKALGYPWKNLDERIPGDDRAFPQGQAVRAYDAIFDELRQQYGEITITERNGMLEELDGQTITIDREHLVAVVTGMWAGSVTRYVYRGEHTPQVKSVANSAVLVDDGFWQHEPEPKHGVNGWCRICHSWCYGDCEANGERYYER